MQAWTAYIAEEELKEKESHATEAIMATNGDADVGVDVDVDENCSTPSKCKDETLGEAGSEQPKENDTDTGRKPIGKGATIYNPAQPGALGSHEAMLPPFYHSREYTVYTKARETEANRQSEALVKDFKVVRRKEIAEWTTNFKELEMKISAPPR